MPLGSGLLRTVLRRIRADWPVLAASAITLLLAGILVSSAPIYSRAVNDAGLQRSLNDSEITRSNIKISGRFNLETFPDADEYALSQTSALRDIALADMVRMGRSDSFAFQGQETVRDLTVFGFYERIEEYATMVDGDWPETTEAPYQVAVSRDVAQLQDLTVGDLLTLDYRHDAEYTVDIFVSGIYQVDDPGHRFWYDQDMEVFGLAEGQSFDTYGPMVVTPAVFFGPATPRASWVRWRIFPDFDQTTTTSAPEIRRETNRLISRLHAQELFEARFIVDTQLNSIIRTLERSLLVTQASVTIVIVQLAILAGYALVLTSRLIVEHRRVESAVLRARGASSRQLFGMSLMEAIVLALPLMLLSPLLAALSLRIFNVAGPLADIDLVIEPAAGSGAWFAAAVAGVTGVLLLSIPVLREEEAAPGAQASRHRQESRSLWQRAGIDLAVLIVAGLGMLQLRRYSSPITETVQGRLGIDPLLVAAPAIGLIAGAVLALRIVPLLARVGEQVAAHQRAALVALGAWQIARRPLVYSRSMLLLLLAVGIGIFTVAHTQTWQQSQNDQADYEVGGDVRVTPDQRFSRQLSSLTLSDAHLQVEGVTASMPVISRLEQFGTRRDLGQVVSLDTAYAAETLQMRTDLQPAGFPGMLEEMQLARPELDAALLPGHPLRLGVGVQIDSELVAGEPEVEMNEDDARMRLFVTLLDGEGYQHRIPLGVVDPDETDVVLEADLFDRTVTGDIYQPVYPLSIVAVEASTLGPAEGDNQGRLTFSAWRVSDQAEGDSWQQVSSESIQSVNWNATTHAFSNNTWAEMDLNVDGDVMTVEYVATSSPRVSVRTATFRVSAPAPQVEAGVPVLISGQLRDLGDYEVGDVVLVPLGSFAFDGIVIGVVDGFPGTNAHQRPVVIVDLPTLAAINERPADSPFGPDERWIGLGEGQVDAVVDQLRRSPYSSRHIAAREHRAADRQSDPVALGTLGALAMGFVAATAVAGAGVVASAAGSARQRMTEFLLMRAIGLSPRQLTGWLFLENSLLILLGVIGGTLLGMLLGWLVLPLIALTPEARQVFPGVQVIIPWSTIGLMQVAGILLLGILTGVLALIVRRGGLGESLRVRED